MARNIEIKARIDSVERVALVAAKLADSGPIEIAQDDTFFRCENSADRLKLRTFAPDQLVQGAYVDLLRAVGAAG